MKADRLEEAKKIFDIEIEAIEKVRDSLDETFLAILELISHCKGKVIVTGMGKPGHVATKIAATFSSLGIPAAFLHPAEAIHGDLGMIDAKDVVIAISYSGESDEITGMLPTIKAIGAPLVAITGKADSTLAQAADYAQIFPNFEEACHMGLAPTSSTTAELVYGDALAVVASHSNGFKNSDFAKLHPAGLLGKKLLIKVEDVMSTKDEMPIIEPGAYIIDAMAELSRKRLSIVCVVEENHKLIGILTDADFRRVIQDKVNIYEERIDSIVNTIPKCFENGRLAVDALQFMKDNHINVMPVLKGDSLVGVIHWQQIIRKGIVV